MNYMYCNIFSLGYSFESIQEGIVGESYSSWQISIAEGSVNRLSWLYVGNQRHFYEVQSIEESIWHSKKELIGSGMKKIK